MGEAETFAGAVSSLPGMVCNQTICERHTQPHARSVQWQDGEVRVKDTEIVIPIVTGTVAFHLGKKVGFLAEPFHVAGFFSGRTSLKETCLFDIGNRYRLPPLDSLSAEPRQ